MSETRKHDFSQGGNTDLLVPHGTPTLPHHKSNLPEPDLRLRFCRLWGNCQPAKDNHHLTIFMSTNLGNIQPTFCLHCCVFVAGRISILGLRSGHFAKQSVVFFQWLSADYDQRWKLQQWHQNTSRFLMCDAATILTISCVLWHHHNIWTIFFRYLCMDLSVWTFSAALEGAVIFFHNFHFQFSSQSTAFGVSWLPLVQSQAKKPQTFWFIPPNKFPLLTPTRSEIQQVLQ